MNNREYKSKDWPHMMDDELDIKISALEKMTTAELKMQWQSLYHTQPPPSIRRVLLIQAIAFKYQEGLFGGLSAVMKRKLKGLAQHLEANNHQVFDPGISLKPGARLIREWHGQSYRVTVLEQGFDFNGQTYSSLSRIAKEITGTRWSGPRFFGIQRNTKRLSQISEKENSHE